LFSPLSTQAQTAEPTPDRLAAPPTVPAPTQADEGAQLYWLYCQPCHGDKGQGLTDAPDDDWRSQYPPEEQYCWNSGCHGTLPYEEGFTIPKQIPAVIGEGSLTRFATLGDMFAFVQTAMPFQMPNSLTDQEYLQVVAFLARENGVEAAPQLTIANLEIIQLHQTTSELLATSVPTPKPPGDDLTPAVLSRSNSAWVWVAGGLVVMVFAVGGLLWFRHGR
jgi:cytochrome c